MPDWTITETGAAPIGSTQLELHAERAMRIMVEEAYADLEALYRDDIGWQRIGAEKTQFTPEGRNRIGDLADLAVTGNALIKRGVALRTAYVWGQGVTVTIRDDGATGQDVNAVWQAFWDDPSNRRAFTSSEAQVAYERRLATRGEAFFVFPTEPMTGRVRVRRVPAKQITDRITDPEDEGTVWFYKRVWSAMKIDPATGQRTTEARTTYYPALGYWPLIRPKQIGGNDIRWDAPMRPVTVNVPDEDWRGLGDVLPALPWARMDKEFLEDLAVYMRALTRILGQVTGKTKGAAAAAAKALRDATNQIPAPGQPSAAGGWAATDANTSLQLVSKSGAQIDADSSKPFATRAASALEVPVTMLLGDPGISGARATAETLDQPTELMARLRREVHAELFRDIANHVIDSAALAPAGPLRGQVSRDGDRLVIVLPEGDERTIEISWPEFDSTPLADLVKAIKDASDIEPGRGGLTPMILFKLAAAAFGVEDVDELLENLTDADGNWLDSELAAADAAVEAYRRGRDPVTVLDGGE